MELPSRARFCSEAAPGVPVPNSPPTPATGEHANQAQPTRRVEVPATTRIVTEPSRSVQLFRRAGEVGDTTTESPREPMTARQLGLEASPWRIIDRAAGDLMCRRFGHPQS